MTKEAKKFISGKISILVREGYPQIQAIAIAHDMARIAGYKVPKANPAEKLWSVHEMWNSLDKMIKRMVELSIKAYRKQGLGESDISKKLMKEYAFSDYEAVGILTDIIPSKIMKTNPVANAIKIYDTILAIEAKKGGKHESLWANEDFRHDFKTGSKAAVYGLEDGSLLIKSQNGKRLWKKFKYNKEDI